MTAACYRILGLSPNASLQEVKVAYRRLAAAYHPDRNAGDLHAQQMFGLVVNAYKQVLQLLAWSAQEVAEKTQACRRTRQGTRSDRRYNWQLPQQYIGTYVNCKA